MPKLSDTKIKNAITAATRKGKSRKLFDVDNLFLIAPQGWWRVRYRWAGKEQTLSVGVYPDVSLATARDRRDEIRKAVANGIDPSARRQEQKAALAEAPERTYAAVAKAWLEETARAKGWTEDHAERSRRRLELHFTPWLGKKDIAEVTEDAVMACVHRIEGTNKIDTAHRGLAENAALMRYARKKRLIKINPLADVRGPETLAPVRVKHHPARTNPREVGGVLRALDAYHGGFIVRCALRFLPLVFVRPGELRLATWSEFDLERAEWRIPPERMKMREEHIVPLSKQAVALLRELQPLTGPDGFVFPQIRNASRPISENTLNVALRAAGIPKEQQSAHGFRTTASTLLNESGEWHRDAIERQLAHGERDKSRAAYNGAQHLPERRRMVQWWADYLDDLRAGSSSQRAA